MKLPIFTALLVFSVSSATAFAADTAQGKKLIDENCYTCHGNDVYTRENRMIQNRPGLTKQVQRCELAQGLQWFDEDVENVAEYLNQQFYHFK